MDLTLERDGRVVTATFRNPPYNFLTGSVVGELTSLVRSVETDTSIGAVILTGGLEGIFISHFDVSEIATGADDAGIRVSHSAARILLGVAGAARRVPGAARLIARSPFAGLLGLRQIHELFARMERSDVVFIAAINGRALGGGLELALACDYRLMALGGGRIGFPEISHGIIPGAGGTQRLARAVGAARAISLVLDARLLDPSEAQELGIVNSVVAPGELLPEAKALARRLARRSRPAIGAAKRAIYAAPYGGYGIERAGFVSVASTPAAARALKAYGERLQSADRLEDELEAWRQGEVLDLTEGGAR